MTSEFEMLYLAIIDITKGRAFKSGSAHMQLFTNLISIFNVYTKLETVSMPGFFVVLVVLYDTYFLTMQPFLKKQTAYFKIS